MNLSVIIFKYPEITLYHYSERNITAYNVV